MLRVRPFAAIRPVKSHAVRVASVPYDVVTTDEAARLAAGNPHSFLHVVRPEIDLPAGTDPYDDAVYAKGRENLQRLLDEAVLARDPSPNMYLYRQVMQHRQQIGLVCCCHIDDYAQDVIKKHEKTRPDKENDRTRHVLTLGAHTGPVFLTYRDQPSIDAVVEQDVNDRPVYHFNSPDGVTHTVWLVKDPQAYVDAFTNVPHAYVADGHHRSASAVRAGVERRAARDEPSGDFEDEWFLTVLFPASQLTILPYNRLVADLNGQSPEEILGRLAEVGRLAPTDRPGPERAGVICVYLDGAWHRLEIDPASIDTAHPVRSLDISLLQERILQPILGIADQRTDERISFVGGLRGTEELARRVDSGAAAIAFSMHATSIDQLLAVADAGLVMPPKSTWFEPKLRSGLFIHTLE